MCIGVICISPGCHDQAVLPQCKMFAHICKEINGHNTPFSSRDQNPLPHCCVKRLLHLLAGQQALHAERLLGYADLQAAHKNQSPALVSCSTDTNGTFLSFESQILVLLPRCLCALKALQTTG